MNIALPRYSVHPTPSRTSPCPRNGDPVSGRVLAARAADSVTDVVPARRRSVRVPGVRPLARAVRPGPARTGLRLGRPGRATRRSAASRSTRGWSRPGDLYVALPGRRHHGAEFAAAGGRAGARRRCSPTRAGGAARRPDCPCRWSWSTTRGGSWPRSPPASTADPAGAMTMYAITGTNGKTTTTYLLEAALRARRRADRADRHHRLPARRPSRGRAPRTTVTTPESTELQGLLARPARRGRRRRW